MHFGLSFLGVYPAAFGCLALLPLSFRYSVSDLRIGFNLSPSNILLAEKVENFFFPLCLSICLLMVSDSRYSLSLSLSISLRLFVVSKNVLPLCLRLSLSFSLFQQIVLPQSLSWQKITIFLCFPFYLLCLALSVSLLPLSNVYFTFFLPFSLSLYLFLFYSFFIHHSFSPLPFFSSLHHTS